VLYKHERLEKKLRKHGRPATAEILAIRTEGSGNSARASWANDDDLTTSWVLCRLELRVTPPGEAPFEATVRTRLNTLKSRGDSVPVLYDPDDHDKLVVDYEADAQAQMESVAAMRGATRLSGPGTGDPELDALQALEEAETGAGSPPAGASDARLDRLQQLADLHDRGALSDAEFAAEKAKILAEG
jgi:hypothetical protein